MTTTAEALAGVVDDAAALGGLGLHDATTAYAARAAADAAYVGSLVVRDTDLPLLRGATAPLHVVLGGGAGQVAGPAGLARRLGLRLVALETTLRDTADPAGNARRVCAAVDAARASGDLADETDVHVALPPGPVGPSWLAAVDEVAAAGLRLVLPVGSPDLLVAIDAALDREVAFRCSGVTAAVVGPRGYLGVLLATGLLFDAEPGAADVLGATTPTWEPDAAREAARARRWCLGYAATDVDRAVAELRALPDR